MKITKATFIYKDNISVVLNSSQQGSILNHKCLALSYHFYCKQVAREAVEVRHILTKLNLVDTLTKGLDSTSFHNYFLPIIVN